MNEACSTHGRNEKCIQDFGWNTWRGDHSEDLGVDGNVILECILGKNRVGRCGLDAPDSGQGPVAVCFKHGDDSSSSMKGGEFLDQLTINVLRRTLLHGVRYLVCSHCCQKTYLCCLNPKLWPVFSSEPEARLIQLRRGQFRHTKLKLQTHALDTPETCVSVDVHLLLPLYGIWIFNLFNNTLSPA